MFCKETHELSVASLALHLLTLRYPPGPIVGSLPGPDDTAQRQPSTAE